MWVLGSDVWDLVSGFGIAFFFWGRPLSEQKGYELILGLRTGLGLGALDLDFDRVCSH